MSTAAIRNDKALAQRARAITEVELATYAERTKRSQAATDRARRSLPLGVPSSFQAYQPHPVVAARAQDSWLEDVDGNRYVDFNMGFGALFAGHVHPLLRTAVEEQLDAGTLFVTPCEGNADVAELLRRALRAADVALHQLGHRGHDGRHPRRQGRHGPGQDREGRGRLPRPPRRGDGVDEAAARRGRPRRPPDAGAGHRGHHARRSSPTPWSSRSTTSARSSEVLRDRRRRLLHRRAGDGEHRHLPAPTTATSQAVREITRRYGTLLIFDEVKTGITAGWSGATGHFGVQPDLVTLAKSIGGGLPIGAFGGEARVHGRDRRRAGSCTSAPTTATRSSWPAAKAVLRDICTPEATQATIDRNRRLLAA